MKTKIKTVLKKSKKVGFLKRKNILPVLFVAGFAALGVYVLISSYAATGNDLAVTNVTISPANPVAGQAVTLTATVQNQGSTPTTAGTVVGVGFAVDGQTIAWNRSVTTSLAAGASTTLTANAGTAGSTWTATAGPHVITATADDNNVIPDEVNEANNSKTLNVTIGNTGNLYITPASTNININSNFTVDLRITPGTGIDGVEAVLTYDATKLQYVSMNPAGTLFDVEIGTQTAGNGTITLNRGNFTSGGVSIDSLVTKLTFKALAGTGSSAITVSGNATKSGTGVYTNPSKTNGNVSFLTPDGTAPTTSITAPTAGLSINKTYTVTANASDNTSVTKVEFYVDGQLKNTDTSSPYSFSLDTNTLTNGNHSFTTKAYDAAGNVGTSPAITASVKNLAEDINEDGIVNLQDFSILAGKFGQTGSSLGRADINGDGIVNLQDFSRLAGKFGQ